MEVSIAAQLLRDLEAEFPGFALQKKVDSRFMRLVGAFLHNLTFGQNLMFMESYTTTIGSTVYTPRRWETMKDAQKVVILRHERVHLRQQRRYGRVLFTLAYLFLFFPIGLAWGRAKLEMEAYEETLRALVEGGEDVHTSDYRAFVMHQFTSSAYLWMWPFPKTVGRWVDEVILRVSLERNPDGV